MSLPIEYINSYKDLCTESFIVEPYRSNGEYHVCLLEKDKNAKLTEVDVYNVPKDSILLAMHKYSDLAIGDKMKKILKPASGVFKCCDYVLMSITKDKLHIVFIELKSMKVDSSEIKKQFKGALCFLDYCQAIIERFCENPLIRDTKAYSHYILISANRRIDKRETKVKQNRVQNTSADDFYHIKVGSDKSISIPFDKLI